MIYITGDTHRDFENIAEFCYSHNTTVEDVIIILGDVGLNYYLDGSDNKGYNANHVRNIELGLDYQNGQIGTSSSDVLATAEATDGDTDINTTDADRDKSYTISRTSDTMGNQLYFRLVKDYCFYGLTIESFEIQFTAEGTFEADVVPSSVGKATSVVRSPFKTNKIDY